MKDQYKFLGILRGRNFNFINNQLIDDLMKNEIIIEDHIDYGDPEYCPIYLCAFMYFNNKVFQLNEAVVEEIYSILKYYVEKEADFQYGLQPIFYKLNSIIDKDKKIKYLKKTYEKIYPKDWQTYSMYLGSGSNGIKSWKEWVFLNLEESPNLLNIFLTLPDLALPNDTSNGAMEIIKDYHISYHLMNTAYGNKAKLDDEGFFNFLETWKHFYESNQQLLLIKDKINELENKEIRVKPILKDLFTSHEAYDFVIGELAKTNIININQNIYTIIIPEKYKKTPKAFISSIIFQLGNKMYLEECTDVDIIEGFNHFFQIEPKVSKQDYDYFKKSPNQDKYLECSNFLPQNSP